MISHTPLQLANLDSLKAELVDLEKKSAQENIWEDQDYAQSIMQQLGRLKDQIAEAEGLRSMLGDIDAATEVAGMEVCILVKIRTQIRAILHLVFHG